MNICSNAGRGVVPFGLSAALLTVSLWPQPAAAFHIKGITVSVTSLNSVTRAVNVDVVESSGTPFGPFTSANIQWGDAMNSSKPWTSNSTTGGGLHFHRVLGVSHIYPDLTDRTIKVTSDCCGPTGFSPLTDTAAVQLGCADTPKGGCDASATKAQLQIKNNSDDSKDKLKFKWLNGTVPSFPAPGEYYLCIYAPGLVLQAVVPPGPNWATTGAGFKYLDPSAAAGGMFKIKLKNGTGTAKILIKGTGTNLDDPVMPLTQPVLVQLQHSSGSCWQHQFTSPEIKNTPALFKDNEP